MEKMKLLPKKEQDYMKQLFKNCTKEIRENMFYIEVKKGQNFIAAGEECRNIFIILSGRTRGIDMQIQGKVYMFKEFGPGRILGEFECLSGIPKYSITVQAVTDCTLCVIPAGLYLRWMRKDGDALFMRTQKLLLELTWQTMEDRKYILLNCSDRLILYLIEQYERRQRQEILVMEKSREELADVTGFCVKTINRNIKTLQDKGFLSVVAGKIAVSKSQYEMMQQYTEETLF
ncbi:MAG: Crp/Fnr family transcriptional regulator [Eubacteriales bacterium]|nr:Crp/Fnr family transcriptional regulator [Eubacteriales bacterium]